MASSGLPAQDVMNAAHSRAIIVSRMVFFIVKPPWFLSKILYQILGRNAKVFNHETHENTADLPWR